MKIVRTLGYCDCCKKQRDPDQLTEAYVAFSDSPAGCVPMKRDLCPACTEALVGLVGLQEEPL